MKTVIFLSGFALPPFISKSKLFFDQEMWKNENAIFYSSKTPTSHEMINEELFSLQDLISSFSETYVVGHSLGAWWASKLACSEHTNIKKMALWTPVFYAGAFPIFKVDINDEIFYKTPHHSIVGKDKTMVIHANNDLIVSSNAHAIPLINKFQASSFVLTGGHAWQSNHKDGLVKMKNWLLK